MNYVAFFRSVNVGGNLVKMQDLRQLFLDLKIEEPETFLASGNVLFNAVSDALPSLRNQIEIEFEKRFGFRGQVACRNQDQITALAAFEAFPQNVYEAAQTNCVILSDDVFPEDSEALLSSIASNADSFRLHSDGIFWITEARQSEAAFTIRQL